MSSLGRAVALNGGSVQPDILKAYGHHITASLLAHLLLTCKGQLLGCGAALVAHLGQLPIPMELEPMHLTCPAQR